LSAERVHFVREEEQKLDVVGEAHAPHPLHARAARASRAPRSGSSGAGIRSQVEATVVVEGSTKGKALLDDIDVEVLVLGGAAERAEASRPREDGQEGQQGGAWWGAVRETLLPLRADEDAGADGAEGNASEEGEE
jgi:hypothetical protein